MRRNRSANRNSAIRQKYVPGGLPHLRASHSGKLVFFRTQVLNWILERQTKGGNLGK
jgi:hypothetical protein